MSKEIEEDRLSFTLIRRKHLKFLNTVRNECRNNLHNPYEFTLDETIQWYKDKKPKFYIIELDGQMVGYFRLSNFTADSVYIGADIHKDFRGKGIGYAAYQKFIPFIKEKYGLKILYLEVLSHNEPALALYDKVGFKFLGKTTKWGERNGQIVDNIVMFKRLV